MSKMLLLLQEALVCLDRQNKMLKKLNGITRRSKKRYKRVCKKITNEIVILMKQQNMAVDGTLPIREVLKAIRCKVEPPSEDYTGRATAEQTKPNKEVEPFQAKPEPLPEATIPWPQFTEDDDGVVQPDILQISALDKTGGTHRDGLIGWIEEDGQFKDMSIVEEELDGPDMCERVSTIEIVPQDGKTEQEFVDAVGPNGELETSKDNDTETEEDESESEVVKLEKKNKQTTISPSDKLVETLSNKKIQQRRPYVAKRKPKRKMESDYEYMEDKKEEPENKKKRGPKKKTYQCKLCLKFFMNNVRLRSHMVTHSENRPHECEECGAKFKRISNLKGHKLLHRSDKPYKCTECFDTFKKLEYLQKHFRIHTGEKRYKCTECDKSFTQQANLQQHMFVHTGEKPFQCDLCPKRMSTKFGIERHRLIHTGAKPYCCDICLMRFRHGNALKTHRLKKHNIEP